MTLHVDPEDLIRFQIPVADLTEGDEDQEQDTSDDRPTFILRPLTAREEHAAMDTQKAWARHLYVLERCLRGWEDFPAGGEFKSGGIGGGSEASIRALPMQWRADISNHLMNMIKISEKDLEK